MKQILLMIALSMVLLKAEATDSFLLEDGSTIFSSTPYEITYYKKADLRHCSYVGSSSENNKNINEYFCSKTKSYITVYPRMIEISSPNEKDPLVLKVTMKSSNIFS